MSIPTQIRSLPISGLVFGFAFPMAAIAQTFSPYTPAQIQEFNSQPIAPIETPSGPVYLVSPPVTQKPDIPFDARYLQRPDGEAQAEAQSTDSVAPFEPIPATITF
jgi:hypothetical protein